MLTANHKLLAGALLLTHAAWSAQSAIVLVESGHICTGRYDDNVTALWGPRHSLHTCVERCNRDACAFFAFTPTASASGKGYCKFWSSCGSRSRSRGTRIFQRVDNASETDAQYELVDSNSKCNESAIGVTRAAVGGLKSRGHPFDACAEECSMVEDCDIFTHTPTGWCTFYSSCDSRTTSGKTEVFSRIQPYETPTSESDPGFVLEEVGMRCNKTVHPFVAGYPTRCRPPTSEALCRQECRLACIDTPNCTYATVTTTGYCRFHSDCDTRERNGKTYIYRRVGRDVAPPDEGFELVEEGALCNTSTALGQIPISGAPIRLSDVDDCMEACRSVNCEYLSYGGSGWCVFWTACEDRFAKRNFNVYRNTNAAEAGSTLFPEVVHTESACNVSGYAVPREQQPFGSRRTVHFCAEKCLEIGNCNFYTLSRYSKGYCRLFETCDVISSGRKALVLERPVVASTPSPTSSPTISAPTHAPTPEPTDVLP